MLFNVVHFQVHKNISTSEESDRFHNQSTLLTMGQSRGLIQNFPWASPPLSYVEFPPPPPWGAYSNLGTQVEVQNIAFGSVSQKDLTRSLVSSVRGTS